MNKQEPFFPCKLAHSLDEEGAPLHGKRAIQEGSIALLLVCGGTGSRLGSNQPKGCTPLSKHLNQSLFEIFASKVRSATKIFNVPIKCALMTSEENDKKTKEFFKEHAFFGLSPETVFFFTQESLPYLTLSKSFLMNEKGEKVLAPAGNGKALSSLAKAPFFDEWIKEGVRTIHFLPVDNPLLDPLSAPFIGHALISQADVVINAIRRESADESLGTLVQGKEGVRVCEYIESRDELKDLESFPFGNISNFCFSTPFVKRCKALSDTLPYHLVKKTYEGQDVYKQETFIFDTFPFASTFRVVETAREICYAPVKRREGENSLKTSQDALHLLETSLFEKRRGRKPSLGEEERDRSYYYEEYATR